MAGEWRISELKDVCERVSVGYVGPTSEYFCDSSVGVRLLRSQNVRPGRLSLDDVKYVEREFHVRNKKSQLRAGDILFVRVGQNRGDCCVVPDVVGELNCANIVFARPIKSLGAFLGFYFRSLAGQQELSAISTGSAQGVLNTRAIASLKVPVPPYDQAKAIATVLGALDDKIELNLRMNATLEATARALFQSWFVDFDPVRAKLARLPPALHPARATLFSSAFQDSALGRIPKGWTATCIGDTCQAIFSGGTPSTQAANYWGGDIPWLSSGETRNTFIVETEKTITPDGVKNSSTRVARAGCTVIAGAGQGHTRGQASFLTFDSYINQSVVALAANPKLSSDLFLFFDLERRYDEFRQLSDSHSSRGSLTTRLLAGVRCILPPHELVVAFDEVVQPLVAQITANLRQSRTLASLRDTLLPRLLTGELIVTESSVTT